MDYGMGIPEGYALIPLEPDFETAVKMAHGLGRAIAEAAGETYDPSELDADVREMQEGHEFAEAEKREFMTNIRLMIKGLCAYDQPG